ncbi:hypothetical protein LCGC14_2826090, partial [marine sediment metagenome]
MVASKHHLYEEYSELGMKFISRWNKMDRDGAQNIMAEEFDLAIPTVYRIRKKLGLKNLHDLNHPGRKALLKKIRKLYWRHESTAKVARAVHMSSQNVNKLLVLQGVELNPPWVVNLLLCPPHNGMTASKFNGTIKKLYIDEGMNAKQIAKVLKCDHNAVCNRLKAMRIDTKQNHRLT